MTNEAMLRKKVEEFCLYICKEAKRCGCKTCNELLANKEFQSSKHYGLCKELIRSGAINVELLELAF